MNKTQAEARQVQPYLFFDGRCEEAIEFYKKALGAEVQSMMRFQEVPGPEGASQAPPGSANKIMHAMLRIGESTMLASDGQCSGKTNFGGITMALQVKDAAEAEKMFAALADGGQVQMPLAETFWSPRFGMLQDKFGVGWMINVVP